MLLAIGLTKSRLLSSCHVLNPWAHGEQGLFKCKYLLSGFI